MINIATYEVKLYLNGTLLGDIRHMAQNLTYTRRRTKVGADSIDFTVNDVMLNEWCVQRNYTIGDILKPIALECRLTRNGVDIVGGFLATMPAYSPLQLSANLDFHFDGYLNLLGGVYIRNTTTNLPLGVITGNAGTLVSNMITLANTISSTAGKGYGFTQGSVDNLPSITHTFDNYKTVKDWICDRCDNTTGAGPFDVYFHPDKTYDVKADANFGDVITDWVAYYPTILNGPSATSISAPEVSDFASRIIGVGSGEISASSSENTAILTVQSDATATSTYGYYEKLIQESSIGDQTSLDNKALAELNYTTSIQWQPEVTFNGKLVVPMPTGSNKIWIGDTITINNAEDLTGMTNGKFRVNELTVDITAGGSESIKPVLERVIEENEE